MVLPHPDQHFGCVTFSQHGEDIMLLNVFKLLGIPQPSYLDIGAHHPVNISNTFLLYMNGSRGVNVEANPNLIGAFEELRPDDVNVNIGVSAVPGVFPFYMYDELSGLNTFSARHVKTNFGKEVSDVIELPVVTIADVVETYCNGMYPHFLSCDVEGLDFAILSSADFVIGNRPLVICVEVRQEDTATMSELLTGKGYSSLCRMGENMIYVLTDLLGKLM